MKNGWKSLTLDELCEIARGGSPRPIKKYITDDPNGINWVKISDATASTKYIFKTAQRITKAGIQRSREVKDGDFILSNSMSFGRPYIMRTSGCIHDGWLLLRDKSKLFTQDYLYYFLDSPAAFEQFSGLAVGSTVKNLKIDSVRTVKVPVPPLPEQRRIVGILDEAFAGIATAKANAEKNLQNTRALFESHLNAVFTQRGDGWVETSLGKEVDLLSGFPFKSARYTDSENDVRLLRGDNIVQGSLRWEDVKRWPSSDTAEYKRYRLSDGDVVLAMDRPWVKAGLKRAQISAEDLPCLLVQRTARLRGNGSLDNRFLVYLISSDAFTRHILGVQTGIGVPHISGTQIKDFQFVKPPKSKQREIVEKFDGVQGETQRLESIYQRKLDAFDELKKSLLHQAFSGQL